jgi:hypothetical protein
MPYSSIDSLFTCNAVYLLSAQLAIKAIYLNLALNFQSRDDGDGFVEGSSLLVGWPWLSKVLSNSQLLPGLVL